MGLEVTVRVRGRVRGRGRERGTSVRAVAVCMAAQLDLVRVRNT